MCGIGLELTALSSPCAACNDKVRACPADPRSPASSPGRSDAVRSLNGWESPNFASELQRRLCQRGPDCYQRVARRIAVGSDGETASYGWDIALHSAVLHLRGDKLTPQPVLDGDDNVLCWNGEVFGLDGGSSEEDERKLMQGSDTALLSQKLQLAGEKLGKEPLKEVGSHADPVVEELRRVQGPFAVAWLHESTKRVYFAHDRFGRRSLLYRRWGGCAEGDMLVDLAGAKPTSTEFGQAALTRFVLSSVAIGDSAEDLMAFQELPAAGIYVLDLQARLSPRGGKPPSYRMEFHPYEPLRPKLPLLTPTTETAACVVDRFGCKLPRPAAAPELSKAALNGSSDAATLEASAHALLIALSNAVGLRVRSIPPRLAADGATAARVAVLFSGGLDSVVVAALAHFHVAAGEPVDLLTVCFDENSGFASPDRRAALLAHAELCALFPARQWNLVKVDVPRSELARRQRDVQTLMAPCHTHMDFNIGAAFWFLSRGRGELTNAPQGAGHATLEDLNAFLTPQRADLRELETQVAALGLFGSHTAASDSMLCPVLRCGRKRKPGCALAVCKTCCFKMQRALAKLPLLEGFSQLADQREAQGYRATLLAMGVQSDAHLGRLLGLLASRRQERLENSSLAALCCRVHRSKQGLAESATTPTPPVAAAADATASCGYQTPARVVLVGIGADEQLAGYGRHCTTLRDRGDAALRAELAMDLGRIWKRNLGRDDRCIAAHGREARFPYLDESVVAAIATFPVSSLCSAELPRGVGDKRALRLVAQSLGLRSCAGLAKRAIQFGTRIAKVSSAGSKRQTKGMNTFSSVE